MERASLGLVSSVVALAKDGDKCRGLVGDKFIAWGFIPTVTWKYEHK
jgi:hypothetical protein